ncbi:MAG: matrixin family metalloprotease [Candidatus Aenigmatarchaeota archaeon]
MKKLLFAFLVSLLLVSAIAVFFSAKAEAKPREPLEKIEFIHWKGNTITARAKQPTCYKFLSPLRVKWPSTVSYVINPTNPQGLSEDFIKSAIFDAAETWDAATSKELMNNFSSIDYSVAYGVQDYKNAITFGNYPTSGVIAVTTVWYNSRTREIVEFDIMFDTDYEWGDATQDSSKMDLQNIATHELGHAVGLGDVYQDACSEVTMYGYSDYGEIQKRTLEQPDITGLQILYGA